MKTRLLFLAALLSFDLLQGQTLRYFETFGLDLPTAEWRDSSYVVATDDPALLAEIESELALPIAERRHISGPIAAGDGGFNRNGSHRFNWHFKPNEWAFAEASVEVCDGRAYTDVAADTAYWLGVLGYYCGWSYRVVREVSAPVAAPEPGAPIADFLPLAPNPAGDEILFAWSQTKDAEVTLRVTDAAGRLSITLPLGLMPPGEHTKPFTTSALDAGAYIATLRIGSVGLSRQFIVIH